MTATEHEPPAAAPERVVKVGPDVIAAAQLRETLDKILGRPTSPVIAKIARADRSRPKAS